MSHPSRARHSAGLSKQPSVPVSHANSGNLKWLNKKAKLLMSNPRGGASHHCKAAAANTAKLWQCLGARGQEHASMLAGAGRRASHRDARVTSPASKEPARTPTDARD